MHLRRTLSLVALLGVSASLMVTVPAAALVNGILDPAFGTAGVARIDLSRPSIDLANGYGGSWMVGSANDRFALTHRGADRGTLVLDFDAPAAAYGAASTGFDGVMAVGRAGDDMALASLSREGSPIPDFGTQGRVVTSFGRPAVARGVAMGADAFVVGTAGLGADADLVLARYDVHGALVPTFGHSGTVVADLSGGGADAAYAVRGSRNPTGAFVLVGRAGGAALVARFLPDGTWDPTFGVGGRVLLDLTAGDDVAYGLDIWLDGGILVSGAAGAGGFVARLSKDGVLEPTFGAGGVVTADLGPGGAFTSVSRSQAGYHTDEEAIVAGGTVVTPSGRDAVVVRLDHDGTYHPGFGTGGRVVVDLGRAVDRVVGIQVGLPPPPGGDPGVAIVVVGDDGADMVSITLDNIGQLSNPPGGGRRVVDFSVSSELAEDFVVQPDGAVVVVASGSQGVAVMRLLPDGRLDPTFGQGGVVVEPGGTATSVALQADGKILVGGSRGMRGHGVYRFLADGRLDVDFGNYLGFSSVDGQSRETVVAQRPDGHIVVGTHNVAILSPSGQLETEQSVGSNRAVVGLAVEPGGAVVAVTGPIYDGSTTGPLAMRILVDGTRDPDFPGSAGVTPAAIVRHPDGRFFVVGEIVTERTPGGVPSKVDVGVAAMTPGGQLDDTFGAGPSGGGWVKLDVGPFDRPSDIALTPDGKILVSFSVTGDQPWRTGLARFLPDGRLDTSFGAKGTWMAALPFVSPLVALALAPGGRVLVAGTLGYETDNSDVVVAAMAPAPVTSGAPAAWGFGGLGQLGVGTAPVVAVAGGTHHTLEVMADGTVRASGWNLTGQLGNGTTVDSAGPVPVAGLTGVVAVAAGTYHSLALKADGTVWAWGWNYFGQVGDGTAVDRHTPVRVAGLTNVTSISAGAYHNLALRSDGVAFAWGWNGVAQLATNSPVSDDTVDRHVPVAALLGEERVVAVAAGSYHSLFLFGSGEIRTAGWNAFGQLGRGDSNRLAPSGVVDSGSLARKYVAIAGGGLHSLGLRADGTVWAWGYNQLGELGDGTTTDSQTPVMVRGVTNAAFVAGGGYHSLVLGRDGTLKAWGWDGLGQLGTAAGSDDRLPAVVTALPAVTVVRGIGAGALHSLAY